VAGQIEWFYWDWEEKGGSYEERVPREGREDRKRENNNQDWL